MELLNPIINYSCTSRSGLTEIKQQHVLGMWSMQVQESMEERDSLHLRGKQNHPHRFLLSE